LLFFHEASLIAGKRSEEQEVCYPEEGVTVGIFIEKKLRGDPMKEKVTLMGGQILFIDW